MQNKQYSIKLSVKSRLYLFEQSKKKRYETVPDKRTTPNNQRMRQPNLSRHISQTLYRYGHGSRNPDYIPTVSRLQSYFHKRYDDARPLYLRNANAWSTNNLIVHTNVSLSDIQVASILTLMLEHDVQIIHPTFNFWMPGFEHCFDPQSILHILLSQFLDAVLSGYLVPQESYTLENLIAEQAQKEIAQ